MPIFFITHNKIYTAMASYTSFLYFALLFVFVLRSSASCTPQQYVDAHNKARANVTTSPSLPLVTWDTNLANYALSYANKRIGDCAMTHSGGPYGENLAKGSSSNFDGVTAIGLWVDEKSCYNYPSNTCATGKVCGHYTQVMWRDSTRIGCAQVTCSSGWHYVVCSYDPPGNWDGEWPY